MVRDEHQRQVAGGVTVRNIITSMRLISDVDWTELFERVDFVDDVFKAGSAFEEMDFPTRNLYRSAVEHLARGSDLTELDVARAAVATARRELQANPDGNEARLADPGYSLIAGGRASFEAAIGFKAPAKAWPGRLYRALGIGGYVGAGAVVAAGLLAIPLSVAALRGVELRWLLLLGVLGLVPAIDAAVALVDHIVTRGFRATMLPALELRGGTAADLRTLVAVPTLLTSIKDVEEQIERLEIHYLASPGRPSLRAAVRLARCAERARGWGRRAASRREGRHRQAEPATQTDTERRPFPAIAPQACLERGRRLLE